MSATTSSESKPPESQPEDGDASAQKSPPEALRGKNVHHTPWLLRRVWDRVNKRNEHFMACIVGREGSGKSHTALKIANAIDESFTSDRVIFDVVELLKVLKDGEHEPGQFYVLDEAGVQLGRRTWQDRGQILANQALQLVRSHNLGLIFTLPRLSELDSQTEGRLQVLLEMTGKKDGEYVTCKWKFMDPDRIGRDGNVLKKFPRRRQNGKLKRITEIRFSPPAPAVVDPYEEEKARFQEEFYEETIQQLEDIEEDEDDGADPRQIAVEISSGKLGDYVFRHSQNNVPYIKKELIRADYDLSKNEAETVKALLERQFGKDELGEYA